MDRGRERTYTRRGFGVEEVAAIVFHRRGPGDVEEIVKSKLSSRKKAPLWLASSPMNSSVTGAWGYAFDGGMGVGERGGGKEAGVGDAIDADAAVVILDIFEEPVNGIPGIGALIGLFAGSGLFLLRNADLCGPGSSLRIGLRSYSGRGRPGRRRYTPRASTNCWVQGSGDTSYCHRGPTVGRSFHEEGMVMGLVLWDIDDRI